MLNEKLICLLLLSSLFSFIFGYGKLVIPIPKQDGIDLKIPSMDLKIGESGIITRVNKDNEFIIANVIVDKIENGVATLSHSKFNAISQRYMPHPLGVPTEGDKVVFRILYNRALIIAPNQNLYKMVVDNNSSMDFIHADIFASFLSKNRANMPMKDDFIKFCSKFSVGLIFMWYGDNLFTLDCNSLVILDRYTLVNSSMDSTGKLPFFTRLSDTALNELFNMKNMKNYDVHYSQFVSAK